MMALPPLRKYPRTIHVAGSRLRPGDEDVDAVPFAALAGRFLVVEEKVDGANAGLSFDPEGRLWLQSRGHFLTGGPRERHFALLKQWAHAHAPALWPVLGARYVLYGEWLYAKHTVFYDALPHYLLEFDVLDTETNVFLSTPRRRALLAALPVVSVPLLWRGRARSEEALLAHVGPSRHKTQRWRQCLREACAARGLNGQRVLRETDPSDLMEGLYIKVEDQERVVARYKYVRAGFLASVLESETHWLDRPIVPNQLRDGVVLFDQ